ncbi:MAG: FtsX-like permease family protein, partial [Candidatus Heimdallarchaeaceae archaeon]
EFENFTTVNQLLVDFRDNITVAQGIKAIERIIGADYQIEKNYPVLNYNTVFYIYQYVFLLLSLLIISMNYLQFIKSLKTIFATFNTRGMQTKEIRREFIKQSLSLLFYPFIASAILGIIFIFLQMPNMVYQIDLYTPVQIKVGLSILLVLLIPVVCLVISFLTLNVKFQRSYH